MSLKSWGLELWDQIDKVFQHSNQGLEQIELFYRTVSDIYKIYLSLVKKHKSLIVPPTSTKSKLVLENSTYISGFNKFIACLNDQAGIYEAQAEEIRENVLNPLKSFIDLMKTSIATQSNDYNKFKANLENNKRILDRVWAKYYQAFVNKKRAEANYLKIKDDKTVPRVDIERVQGVAIQKMADFEKMRGEYASHLQIFNSARNTLYLQDLPKMCSELEIFDRRRAEVTTETGVALVSIQKRHLERTGMCNDAIGDSMRFIDFKADSTSLVTCLKTTFVFPPDMVFVDLERSKTDVFNAKDFPGISQQGGKIEKSDSAKSLFGGLGLRGIETKDMLPEQVKLRLDDINTVMKNVEKKLAGLKVLEDSYVSNPNMGDKSSLQPQIDVNERQMVSLREMTDTVAKYSQNSSNPTTTTGSARVVGGGYVSAEGKKSTVPMVGGGGVDSDGSFDDDEEDFDGTIVDSVTSNQNRGTSSNMARVLYDFEPTDSQQLAVVTDTNVRVLTYDDNGSGWTLVQNMDDQSMKGYVPTNYIQMV